MSDLHVPGLPPMTVRQAADWAEKLQIVEGGLLEFIARDPDNFAQMSAKASIVLLNHARQIEQELADSRIVMAAGRDMLLAVLGDHHIGKYAQALIDSRFATQSDPEPVESLPQDRAETG